MVWNLKTCSRKGKIEILIIRILPLRQSAHRQYMIESQRQNMMKDKDSERARIRRKRRRGGRSSSDNTRKTMRAFQNKVNTV